MRLRAVREYTGRRACCGCSKPVVGYHVTFCMESGVVIAGADFTNMDEADFIVDTINEKYNELGEPGDAAARSGTWSHPLTDEPITGLVDQDSLYDSRDLRDPEA